MRDLTALLQYRNVRAESALGRNPNPSSNGIFVIPSSVDGSDLRIIATNGAGWDHVSVSTETRCPSWEEMEQIARLFFGDTETAMQLHVPAEDHINCHPYCLHWWRPNGRLSIPRPPSWMVGPGYNQTEESRHGQD